MKHVKHMLADQEAGGSSNQPGNLSSHSGGDDDPDKPDGTTYERTLQNIVLFFNFVCVYVCMQPKVLHNHLVNN